MPVTFRPDKSCKVLLSHDSTGDAEGATRLLPVNRDAEGAARLSPGDAEGATRLLPVNRDAEGATRLLPTNSDAEGATRLLPVNQDRSRSPIRSEAGPLCGPDAQVVEGSARTPLSLPASPLGIPMVFLG